MFVFMNRKDFLRTSLGVFVTAPFLGRISLAGGADVPLAPAPERPSAGPRTWELIGGVGRNESWAVQDGHNRVRALATFRGELYAGIGTGDAEVWRFNGQRWERVGGHRAMGSWPSQKDRSRDLDRGSRPPWVNVLLADPEHRYLYAGVKQTLGGKHAQLWRFDGSKWELIGGTGKSGDWNGPDFSHVYTLEWHQGKLCVGLQGHLPPGNSVHDSRNKEGRSNAQYNNGEIYRFDGDRWECIANIENFPPFTHWIYKLTSFNGHLYASIVRHGLGTRFTGEVWRLKDNRWEQIGGDGVNGSWRIGTTHIVTSMLVYEGKLFIGYNCQECAPLDGHIGNIWCWDGKTWEQLQLPVECQTPSLAAEQGSFNDLLVFQGRLIVGGGHGVNDGKLAVWELADDRRNWRCLGAPATDRFIQPADADLWRMDHYVYSLTTFRDALIMGARGPAGSAHVWRYTP